MLACSASCSYCRYFENFVYAFISVCLSILNRVVQYTESTYVLYVATKSIYLCIKINYQFCTVKLLQALAISIRIESDHPTHSNQYFSIIIDRLFILFPICCRSLVVSLFSSLLANRNVCFTHLYWQRIAATTTNIPNQLFLSDNLKDALYC